MMLSVLDTWLKDTLYQNDFSVLKYLWKPVLLFWRYQQRETVIIKSETIENPTVKQTSHCRKDYRLSCLSADKQTDDYVAEAGEGGENKPRSLSSATSYAHKNNVHCSRKCGHRYCIVVNIYIDCEQLRMLRYQRD